MSEQPFQFELYRLNVVDDASQFSFMGRQVLSDDDIVSVLHNSATGHHDLATSVKTASYRWTVREFVKYALSDSAVVRLSLVRLTVEKSGLTVTEDGIEEAVSEFSPPLGKSVHLFFYLRRHLVAVEYNSELLATNGWLDSFHQILDDAARSLHFRSELRLEPLPKREEIIAAFRKFDRLTRLRVHLRLPNPDLSRYTRHLYDEMQRGGIREYLQDMRNTSGLSKEESALPFAAAAMAQAGYKKGEVVLEGVRGKKRSVVRTGRRAARGKLEQIRDFARGIGASAKSKEAQAAVMAIVDEINRITEPSSDQRQ